MTISEAFQNKNIYGLKVCYEENKQMIWDGTDFLVYYCDIDKLSIKLIYKGDNESEAVKTLLSYKETK